MRSTKRVGKGHSLPALGVVRAKPLAVAKIHDFRAFESEQPKTSRSSITTTFFLTSDTEHRAFPGRNFRDDHTAQH